MKLSHPWYAAVLVGLLAVLPAMTNIRLGSLQPQDLVLLFLMGYCTVKWVWNGLILRISTRLTGLYKSYAWLLLVLFFLGISSVRLDFFPLEDVSILKQPVIFSLSKLLQLAAVICGFLWLTNIFLAQKRLLIEAMTLYWLTGLACSVYAIGSYLWLAVTRRVMDPTSIMGAYANDDGLLRARGLFNEGGPFGVYLVSVLVIGLLRRQMTGRSMGWTNVAVLSLAFILAASKAGLFAGVALCLYSILAAASFWKRISYLALAAVAVWFIAIGLGFGSQIAGYIYSFQNIEQEVASRGVDLNLVTGRVAALYIVPHMIAAHPLTGIGFGNYPLMRNDPHYLGVLPSMREIEDVPGIGIPGIAAEMGLPVTLWLLALLFTPYWISRKQGTLLAVAALFQPMAHTFAVQITFFYPWFVSACVLAVPFGGGRQFDHRNRVRTNLSPSKPCDGIGANTDSMQSEAWMVVSSSRALL